MKGAMQVKLPSPWVREFIRKHGGVLNVAWRMVCRG